MARHQLTPEEKLRGVRRAIRKLKMKKKKRQSCPHWLIPSMQKMERQLSEQLKR